MSLQDVLEIAENVLQDCHMYLESDDIEETDHTFELESCNRYLSAYISSVLLSQPSSYNCTVLREFHQWINELWPIKLARIEGHSVMPQLEDHGS